MALEISARRPGRRSTSTPSVQSGSVSRDAASRGAACCGFWAIQKSLARSEWPHGRTLDHVARRREARAVTGAVPGLLGGVPIEQAAHVGAARGAPLRHAVGDEVV